jgi:tetratricopeptide (TPR) repeat protein
MNLEFELNRLKRNSETAWARLDYETSEDLLRQRQKLSPQDPRPLLDLGFQSGLRCDYAKATEYFEKAIRVAGWQTAAFTAAGFHCLTFSQPALARGYFDRALKKNPAAVEILPALADICERLGQLDEAEEFAARAITADAGNKHAQLVRAKVLRRRKRLEDAESVLRKIIGLTNPDSWLNARVGYELGLNLDQQGRFDEAMAAFLDAKKILIPTAEKEAAYQRNTQKNRRLLADAVSAEALQGFHGDRERLQPARRIGFLVGHPRSGTTLLEQVLDAHPDAVSLEETEIFIKEGLRVLLKNQPHQPLFEILNHAETDSLGKARATYFRLAENFLGQPLRGRLLIDKNPSLTPSIPAIARIFPEARFLIALRDPRDVCLSCFMQPLPVNPVSSSYLTLDGTVAEYASMMDFWLTIRDKMATPWLEVRYEDMVDDLESTARRTLDFLDLPWSDGVLSFNEHAQKKLVRSPTYADVGKPIYKTSQGRWKNYQKYLEPHLARLEPLIKAFGYE